LFSDGFPKFESGGVLTAEHLSDLGEDIFGGGE
jgi:hypothetical protein